MSGNEYDLSESEWTNGAATSEFTSRDRWPEFDLDYTLETNGPTEECTVYPREATEDELMTQWITAAAGSFVDLKDAR
ncbi:MULTISPECIES: hypothetical protein [unclassified Haladaptatus]|uniref:DUF7511 domain-containing protein n=1 Tax=unclassified Haladaptatus TaxID=2622732 RepID=UPI0023E86D2A|nr:MULTISPECIES: hypothetical protein [unclassified Haladaptatus]